MFNPFPESQGFSVLGIPWIEDLHRRVSNKVRVVFEGGEVLNQEIIYSVLRRYGPIKDITTQNDPKDPIKCAIVEFCILVMRPQHVTVSIPWLFKVHKSTLRIFHPREVSMPSRKVLWTTRAFRFLLFWHCSRPWLSLCLIRSESGLLSTKSQTRLFRHLLKTTTLLNGSVAWPKKLWQTLASIFTDQPTICPIPSKFMDRAPTVSEANQAMATGKRKHFYCCYRPTRQRQKDLVTNFVLKDRSNVLTIDCKQLTKAQNDSSFIRAAASQLGYYPVFLGQTILALISI